MKINPFKLERLATKYEFSAKYMLSPADCESFSIDEILDLEPNSREVFGKQSIGYTEPRGLLSLRRLVSQLYETISEDEIFMHSGTEDAIFVFMNALLDSGDHVVVQSPCFQSLIEIPRAIGCDVTKWEPNEEKGWEFDVNFLSRNIQKNTKAIIITNPHNPTGSSIGRERLQEIVDIARENNCIIFSDELFKFLEYDGKNTPSVCDLYENAVSAGGLSKSFGLPGLRISWIATKNKEFYKKIEAYNDYTSICNSGPSEFLACITLRNKDKILKRNKDIVTSNFKIVNEFFEKYADIFSWNPPKSGCLGFPGFKHDVDAEAFCEKLMEQTGIYLVPSTVFDYGNKHFRIGYGRKNFPEVLSMFEKFVNENLV